MFFFQLISSFLFLILLNPIAFAKGGFGPDGKTILPGTSWHWQLTNGLRDDLDVTLYDIDLIDTEESVIKDLQTKDKIVICYFSAGTAETFRDDYDDLSKEIQGKALSDFPDEFWLDIRAQETKDYVIKRLNLAQEKGCNGVEPDNVDAYVNDSGFNLTKQDQIDFNKFIANEAHARDLSVGLKNALEIIPDLVEDFDWALNEQCAQYKECSTLLPFVDAGKAVFQAEYKKKFRRGKLNKKICDEAKVNGFELVTYRLNLDGKRFECR